MSYNHATKVGNRGDVWKHFALLVAVRASLAQGHQRFRYCETHCGQALYVLPEQGEWRRGIGRILPVSPPLNSYPYFSQFSKALDAGDSYPSSWLQVGSFLLGQGASFALEIYDISPEVAEAIAVTNHSIIAHASFKRADGFEALLRSDASNAADFTLIDPPYSPDSEHNWKQAVRCAALLNKRAARFLIWYPIFWPTKPRLLVAAVGTQGFEVVWHPFGEKSSQLLKGCGVIADRVTSAALRKHESAFQTLAAKLDGRFNTRVVS